jgi:hypothetical protein
MRASHEPELSHKLDEKMNHMISHYVHEKPCSWQDCPIHGRPVEKVRPIELVTVGKSRYDPQAVWNGLQHQEQMKRKFGFMKTALLTADSTLGLMETFDVMDQQ